MSVLFTPQSIGKVNIKNRFVQSATYEGCAEKNGKVSDAILARYEKLAKGGVGLIIPGYLYVHPKGKPHRFGTGIHNDEMIPGLKKLTDVVHQHQGKIFFQLNHAGRQTTKALVGETPMGPSKKWRDPIHFFLPNEMSEDEILETIKAFGQAAGRSAEAGADGIQLHGAHGFLINQFISPFFNHRKDKWGGAPENQFRYLKEVVLETRKHLPKSMPITIKLSTNDFTPKPGITLELAAKYSQWLAELGIDGIEVSCGSAVFSFMNMCRGKVPVAELVKSLPKWQRPIGKMVMAKLEGKYDLEELYNLDAAKLIKPNINGVPLMLVGGIRTVSKMEETVQSGFADFISMSRPFIREPNLVNRIKTKKIDRVSCESCNRCLAAVANDIPVKCYNKNFPK